MKNIKQLHAIKQIKYIKNIMIMFVIVANLKYMNN